MLQNIDDSLNCFAFVGSQKVIQSRATRVAKHKQPNVEAIQGAEQVCVVVTDVPNAETLFEPLRSFPKWLVDERRTGESPRQIADQTGMPVGTIYGMLKSMQRAIVRAIDESDREVRYPLRGKAIRYIDPIEPVADEDWEALR